MDKQDLLVAVRSAARETGVGGERVQDIALSILIGQKIGLDDSHSSHEIDETRIIKMMIVGETSLHGYHIAKRNFNLLGLSATITAYLADMPQSVMPAFLIALLASCSAKISLEEAALLVSYKQLSDDRDQVNIDDLMHRVRAVLNNTKINKQDVVDYVGQLRKRGVIASEINGVVSIRESMVSLPV
jgi:hypothetical protein